MKTWCKKLSEALRAKLEINGGTCGFFHTIDSKISHIYMLTKFFVNAKKCNRIIS